MAILLNTVGPYLDNADKWCRRYIPQLPDHAVSEVALVFFSGLVESGFVSLAEARAKSGILVFGYGLEAWIGWTLELWDRRGDQAIRLLGLNILKDAAKGATILSLVATARMAIIVAYRFGQKALGFTPTDRTRPNFTVAFEDIGSFTAAFLFKACLQKSYIPSLKTHYLLDAAFLTLYAVNQLAFTARKVMDARISGLIISPPRAVSVPPPSPRAPGSD